MLLLAIVSLGVPLALSLGARVNAEVRSQALSQAELVAATAAELLGPPVNSVDLRSLVHSAGNATRGRVIVVDRRGRVVADSDKQPAIGQNYATAGRPEVLSALRGTPVQNSRPSSLLHQGIVATAVPIKHGIATVGAVRVTQSVASVHSAVRRTILGLGVVGLVVLALGLTAGAFIAGQIARPLRRLERVARQIAGGDLSARAAVEGSSEQRSLGESFNEMTDRIVRLLNSQRDFVADASHQLRTPLTGLRLRLGEARAAGVSAEAARELDAAVTEVDRFARIIDELLVLSRAGERELPGELLELDQLAAHARERWRRTADDRHITLQHARDGKPRCRRGVVRSR